MEQSTPPPGERVHPGVLVGVSVWRVLIIVLALVGISQVLGGFRQLEYLSQLASLVTAAVYLTLLVYPFAVGLRRHEPRTPWLRGATVVMMLLVSITFMTMLNADLSQTASLFEHLLTPLVVLVDWIAVGNSQANVRWWFPFSWISFPVAYLLFYLAYVGNGQPLYYFLDPYRGDFVSIVIVFLAGVVAGGFVVYGLGKLHGVIRNAVSPGVATERASNLRRTT